MASAIEPLLRIRYGDFINPQPSEDSVAALAPFVRAESRGGRTYNFPVYLGLPHGVTHDDTRTAFSLNAVVAQTFAEASLTGSSILVRENVSYSDVFATQQGVSAGGGAGGAYMSAWDAATMGLMQAGELYRELALLWGPGSTSTAASNIGVVSTSVSGANLAAPQVVNLTRASWIPGLWPKMTGGKVDIYQSDAATLRASGVTVTNSTSSTNRLTLTKAGSGATVAAGDIIVPQSALDVSCYGLDAIADNTGSLFGISATTYPQWRCSTQAVGSTVLTRAVILGALSRTKPYGAKDGGVLLCSGACVADLIDEAAELRRDNGPTDTIVHGASAITYSTPVGPVKVQVHNYMKQGTALYIPNGKVKRVGATDLTFDNGKNEWFYQELADSAGSQLRIYSEQAIICEEPWQMVKFSGIESTYDTSPA